MNVPKELKKARKEKGLDRQQAAAAIGASAPAWSNWERGVAYPSNRFIPTINKVFGLEIKPKAQDIKVNQDHAERKPRINRGGSERIRVGDERSLSQKVMDKLPCPEANSGLKISSRKSLLACCSKKKKDGRGTCQRCRIWTDDDWLPDGVEVVRF